MRVGVGVGVVWVWVCVRAYVLGVCVRACYILSGYTMYMYCFLVGYILYMTTNAFDMQ